MVTDAQLVVVLAIVAVWYFAIVTTALTTEARHRRSTEGRTP